MVWVNVDIPCEQADAARIETICELHGAVSVALADAADEPLLEPAPGDVPLWQSVLVTAMFEAETGLEERLRAALPPGIVFRGVGEDDWVDAWRQHVTAHLISDRLAILPHGDPVPAAFEGAVVRLDPGMAFGTGSHPTTALCLQWLATLPLTGRTVVDYGCGSGILALAAARLGAARVIAVDHDPQACAATQENAALNGLSALVEVMDSTQFPDSAIDVLVANILARPLIELAPQLGPRLTPNADVALAGVLETDGEVVAAAWAPWCRLSSGAAVEGWTLLTNGGARGRH